jgi:ketosteroid isomerase-like protein
LTGRLTRVIKLLSSAVILTILAACGDAGAGDPAQTVEQYMQAKVDRDIDSIRALLCSDMEQFLDRESNTFATVTGATIEGMECTEEGDEGVVRCKGSIVALYGTEEQEFPLVSYQTINEAGEWKWCGEAP